MSSLGGCQRGPASARLGGAGAALLALVAAGCGRRADAGSAPPPEAQYLQPPSVLATALAPDGGLVLSGEAPPGAEVRLQAPDGAAFAAASGEDGTWSVTLPRAPQPRMFAMEGDDAGRILHADGALLLLPPPGPRAVLARPGYGSKVIGPAGGRLRLEGADFDGAGGGAVSGTAPPGAAVRFLLDGQLAGAGVADRAGRFTVLDLDPRSLPVAPGRRLFRVEAQKAGAQEQEVEVVDAAPPPGQVFLARRETGAWRVTWRIPGGGAQTSVIFDPPESAP